MNIAELFGTEPDTTLTRFAYAQLKGDDWTLAAEYGSLLPGAAHYAPGRNGHVLVAVFFREPVESWIPRGILQETAACFSGAAIDVHPAEGAAVTLFEFARDSEFSTPPFEFFAQVAWGNRNDPDDWWKRARWLGLAEVEKVR